MRDEPAQLERALVFTVALMGILLAHELGHYAVARAHGFRLSLPWFLPAPFLVGTFGAIISLEEEPRTRRGLLEMGAAGPLVGLVVIGIVMLLRLAVGGVDGGTPLAQPLLWRLLRGLAGQPDALLTTADPIGFAAWLGCLLTAMNLLPFGQLDGGHVVAALAPRGAVWVSWCTTVALLVATFWWPGWAVWVAFLHVLGTRHPIEPRRDDGFPTGRPILVACGVVLAFMGCFMLAPIP